MTSLAASDGAALGTSRRASPAERLLAFVERSHARACAALVLLCLACFLPGFASLHPMDRDEPRFAQASKQMLETGDLVDIRFQDEARHKKPVGIYWLQSAAVSAAEAAGVPDARRTIAAYRVPSLIGALATVLLTYWAALAFLPRRHAALAAALMAASVILMVEARLAKTDAALCAAAVATMGGLARAYLGRAAGRLPASAAVAFWAGVAAAILIKGPLILLFAGLPALLLSVRERSGRWLLALRPGLGALATLAVVAPWFVAIAVRSGGGFYAHAVGHDMLGKVGTAQTYHWAPPGFYLAAFFATFWPGAILAAGAVPFAWANRREDPVAFALAWIVPAWLVFEAVPTKLPHYVMPLYPAVAILAVAALVRGAVSPDRPLARPAALAMPLIPAGVTALVVAAAWSLDRQVPAAALPLLLAATLASFVAWRLFCRGAGVEAALANVAAAAILAVGVFGLAQPVLASLKVSPRLAEAARAACPDPRIATLGYREPSLVFLTSTDLAMLDGGAQAAAFLRGEGCRVVLVERRHEADFAAAVARDGLAPALAARVAGFNINGGRRVDLGVYAVKP